MSSSLPARVPELISGTDQKHWKQSVQTDGEIVASLYSGYLNLSTNFSLSVYFSIRSSPRAHHFLSSSSVIRLKISHTFLNSTSVVKPELFYAEQYFK